MTAMVTVSTNNNIRTIFFNRLFFAWHEKRDYVFNDWKEFERE